MIGGRWRKKSNPQIFWRDSETNYRLHAERQKQELEEDDRPQQGQISSEVQDNIAVNVNRIILLL